MNYFKNLLYVFLFIAFVPIVIVAEEKFVPSGNKNLAVVYTYDTENDKRFNTFIETDLTEIGYFLNDEHKRVNDVYEKKFGSTNLETLGFSPILNESVVRPLLAKDPRLGGFSPFNLVQYRKQSDKKTVITHLTPEAILDIVGIDDKEIKDKYIASFKPLDNLIEKKLGGQKSYIPLVGLTKDRMMNFEITFEEPEDIDDLLDTFRDDLEYAFLTKGYIIAGFYDIKGSFNSDDEVMDGFTSFWSYSLCHLPFSYAVFDGKNAFPEAGIFAPCSIYIYVKEGENKLVIGMPTLRTWAVALGITDRDKLKKIVQLDQEIPEIFKSLGGVAVANGNPLHSK
ncbi:MAG: hypothetical protein ACI9TV_002405 [Sulfurimonas sp.]|jgi:uncharacterized protein (DUF302 family)|uniref:hypothetical protein n=1 Tax=Sulfurimonas sp. TaxID=2022749 RepID=UPI0039E70E94